MKKQPLKRPINEQAFPVYTKQTKEKLQALFFDENLSQGETLKAMRELLGLTQIDFAKLLQISQTLVSLWEKEEKKPDCYMLLWLAALYSIPAETLLLQFGYDVPIN